MKTYQIFQESFQNIQFSLRKKYHKDGIDQIFQESFLKISLEQIRFSRRSYPKNRLFAKLDAFDYYHKCKARRHLFIIPRFIMSQQEI